MKKEYYLFKETGLILPKESVDEATRMVKELRRQATNGEIDLTVYEDMLDDYREDGE